MDFGLAIARPFNPRYNDTDDPATVNLTQTLCDGVSQRNFSR